MTTKIIVGDVLRNNDPRCPADKRDVKVTGVFDGKHADLAEPYVTYQAKTRTAAIKLDRIFFDGKPRHQGYNYVGQPEQKYGFKRGDHIRILPAARGIGVPEAAIGLVTTITSVIEREGAASYGTGLGWVVRQEHLEPATA